jgi:PAS domain S-box-containing protein
MNDENKTRAELADEIHFLRLAVADLKQREIDLNRVSRERDHRFESLISAPGTVIIWLAPDLRILEWNSAAERLYGWKRERVLGKNYGTMFLPEEIRDLVVADVEKVLAGEPTEGFENPVRPRQGPERILRWNVSRVIDPDDQSYSIIAIAQDVTESRHAEAERERLISQLAEALARVRTLEGMLPICATCKAIRDEEGQWHRIESYLRQHSRARFSHGICPDCARDLYPDEFHVMYPEAGEAHPERPPDPKKSAG